jgi:16S rRNA (guanine527-N7)-methyltransferase
VNFAKDGSDSVKIFWRIEQWFPELDKQTKDYLKLYHTELLRFNKTVNLIGVKTIPHADAIHFADCILASRIVIKEQTSEIIYDLGSGNGFPGIIFSLLMPQKKFRLVEVDQRKSEFLKHMISRLGLKNAEVINRQVESLEAGSIESAVCRGFAPISKALLMTRKVFALNGKLLHLKSEEWATEVAEIPTQLCTYWQPSLLGEYKLPVGEVRYSIVKTEKIS